MTAAAIDYLVVGHVCCDQTATGCQPGGTVAYAGRTAQVLGCNTGIVTSAHPDYNLREALPDLHVHCIAADASTTFTNRYTPAGREQTIHQVATPLQPEHIPAAWRRATIVHLGPIANEINPDMINLFSNSLIGLTPQGWLRHWGENGRVFARKWEAAPAVLPLAAAVIISEEDLLHEAMLAEYRRWSRLLVLTQGYNGCTVFFGEEVRKFPAPRVDEVELTGAGDVFAAAYFLRLRQTGGNPWEAAGFANEIAAQSVTQATLPAKMKHLRSYVSNHL